MKWHINQRVRLARPMNPAKLNQTGTIHSFQCFDKGTLVASGNATLVTDTDCVVIWDTGNPMGNCQRLDQLEPIVPEGAGPSEFKTVEELLDSLNKVEEKVRC